MNQRQSELKKSLSWATVGIKEDSLTRWSFQKKTYYAHTPPHAPHPHFILSSMFLCQFDQNLAIDKAKQKK